MKNLLIELITDFEYNNNEEYYFSTTYLNSDFYVRCDVEDREFNNLIIEFDVASKLIPHKIEVAIKALLITLIHEGAIDTEENER
jgi:hypothetical protein